MDFARLLSLLQGDNIQEFQRLVTTENAAMVIPSDTAELLPVLSHNCPIISASAFFGAGKCLEYLLKNGADPFALDSFQTPISFFAVSSHSTEVLNALQRRGVSFNGSIFAALQCKNIDAIQWLHQGKMIRPDELDCRGFSIGLCALLSNNEEILNYIFKNGFGGCLSTSSGSGVVLYCLKYDLPVSCKFMIDKTDESFDEKDENGETALEIARRKGCTELEEIINRILKIKALKEKKEPVQNHRYANQYESQICLLT